MLHESVMLLGCTFGERLEPVGIVCDSVLDSPGLDTFSHFVGYGTVERCSVINDVTHLFIYLRRKVLTHFLFVEDIFSEVLGRTFLVPSPSTHPAKW